jgi:AcrR family transcriptional regulator
VWSRQCDIGLGDHGGNRIASLEQCSSVSRVAPGQTVTSSIRPREVASIKVQYQVEGRSNGSVGPSLLEQTIAGASRRRSSAETEIRALVDATFDVIAATGSLDPPIRDILDAAQLSRQVFYRHFRSKDELLLVVLDESRQIVAAYLRKRVARVDGANAKLRAWIDGVMRQAQNPEASQRTRPFAVTGRRLEAQFPEQYALSQALLTQPLTDLIREGIEEGVFVSSRPEDDALIIYDATFLRQNRHLLLRTSPTRKTVDDIHDFAVRALRPMS